jgi:hypothetical protein
VDGEWLSKGKSRHGGGSTKQTKAAAVVNRERERERERERVEKLL